MSLHQSIRTALETHLAAMTDVPAIAWEDVQFEPPSAASWLRVTLAPASTDVNSLYDVLCLEDRGLLLVDAFVPENQGPSASDALGDAVRSHFKPGTNLISGGVTVRCQTVRREAGRASPPWRMVPIAIGYTVLSLNS